MAPPPSVPSIHRRTSSSASRDSASIPHVSHPNMNIERPQHLQRRASSRSLRTSASSGSPKRHPRSSSSSRAGAAKTTSSPPRSASRNRIRIPRHSKSYESYTFQHPRHSMSVSLRPAQPNRISFLPSPHPTSASLQSLLNDMERLRGSRLTTSSIVSTESSNPCRISPSPGGVKIWEIMTNMRRQGGRQLCWMGVNESDPWFHPFESSDGSANSDATTDSKHATRNSNSHQYKSINPYDELAKLPSHSPILTNFKRRLPNRADVGFSNPTEEEIRLKMAEVQKECEWQECSPRICLLTGFGVSQNSSTESTADSTADNYQDTELHISCRKEMEAWNGGRIPGIPYAGRDLIDCYKVYQRFKEEFNSNTTDSSSKSKHHKLKRQSKMKLEKDKLKDPRTYSIFAPPLDAIQSKSNLWKPRPFNDRPAGMRYLLACPCDLRDVNDNEPLFCTMALYLLPQDCVNSNNKFKGKISEDFFFPAGNWNVLEGPSEEQSWRRRKRRALFSYDPLDCEEDDLFLIVQVFRAANSTNVAVDEMQESKKRGLGSKIKNTFKKSKSRTDIVGEPLNDDITFDSMGDSGPRFLSPISFSVVPVFPTHDPAEIQQWPLGETMRAPFYDYPDESETQEDFVDRLLTLAECQRGEYSSSTDGNFRSYAPITKITRLVPLTGYVDIFSSFLGRDFTQALLHEPTELADASDDRPSTNRPQLLTDVMGESAICFDGENVNKTNTKASRSKLRRLPPTPASKYTSSFDIKEVLYLPPRFAPRKYEEDAGLNTTSFLNLLYVYPRLIRVADGRNQELKLSLRVRVVEQELHDQSFDGSDALYQPLHSVYNPNLPAGPPMIESYYTKLSVGHKQTEFKNRRDVYLKDEVKIRLPDVLDRRHFLEFSLFVVDDGLDSSLVAKTAVPFIISSKESTSGGRVTTIIPNGLHRIQLGETFQIHIETRLASSFHISDAAVATILRDYPLSSLVDGPKQHLSITPFVDILSMASGQAVKRFFLPLVTIQMIGMMNQSCPMFYYESLFNMFGSDAAWHRLVPCESVDALTACIRSIGEVLDKTKVCFSERDRSIIPTKYHQWIKEFIDSLDEKCLLLRDNADRDVINPGEVKSSTEVNPDSSFEFGVTKDTNKGIPELQQNLSMLSRSSSIIRSPRKVRPSAVFEAPFSRQAFVATRIEQMQADAELFDDGGEYIDDDQTIATYATATSRMTFATITSRMDREVKKHPQADLDNQSSLPSNQTNAGNTSAFGFSTPPRRSPSNDASSTPFSFASKRAEYLSRRVNTMAQLVAPCIAPSLTEAMAGDNALNVTVKQSSTRSNSNSIYQSNKNAVEPGSDNEEEGETKSFISLRGNQSCLKIPPLQFHFMTDTSTTYKGSSLASNYLYELICSLWVHSWTSFAAQLRGAKCMHGSGASVSLWPYEIIEGTNNPSVEEKLAISLIRNIAFFLPLVLKSLAARCTKHETTPLVVPMTFLDDAHMQILVPLVESIALGTMKEATSGSSSTSNTDQMLARAICTNQYALDFFIGLFALLHPSQVSTLIHAYFRILEECENAVDKGRRSSDSLHKQNFRHVKCARLIRLHAVEKLASMPTFIALNYPPKYTGYCPRKTAASSSWIHQGNDSPPCNNEFQACLEKIDRYPQSFWLSGLLMDQCITISLRCCKAIIVEAKSQLSSRYGNIEPNRLTQEELTGLQALAFQSASCAHNHLIRRHANDLRFQTIEGNTRVAAMFADEILEQLVRGTSILSRLEPNQKVRCWWVLCLLYVLQESPEVLLRNKLRSFCQDNSFHIIGFVNLLTLSNVTLQHLMVTSSHCFEVVDERTEEMTQESFNCLSASVIVVVDECAYVTSAHKVNQLARSIFGVLLHLLTTPQSSVTLLRTLGGAAHAFDRFGSAVFMRVVGDDLQHWGRVIFTLMNSTELSVRSMAVDFIVSLLGGVYNEVGSIDVLSLAFLTVLPEVAAREIALYHTSDLTKTMDDVEITLWPLRRAFADIEETDPGDDDRVDHELLPLISTFCRTGQAILDGILVELRLKGFDPTTDLLTPKSSPSSANEGQQPSNTWFDADEESVLEAATFFSPESGMPQKLRWLLTLRDIHISKAQWVEAAETLILSANSILDSIPYIVETWTPWPFGLWTDLIRSPWLSSVGLGKRALINETIMEFACSFRESPGLINASTNCVSIESVCTTLSSIIDQAFLAFDQEGGLQDLAYDNFESLLKKISSMISNKRKFRPHDISLLRRVRGTICTKLARLDKDCSFNGVVRSELKYVRVILRGRKPARFIESTTIPTYFEWNMPSICRVSLSVLSKAKELMSNNPMKSEEECICSAFSEKYVLALKEYGAAGSVMLRIGESDEIPEEDPNTYIDIAVVEMKQQPRSAGKSRKFYFRNNSRVATSGTKEFTVAHKCPHVLSRQRSLVNDVAHVANKQR